MLRATFLVALAWLLAAPPSAQSAPKPIVFDFEDQTSQGWRLQNAFLHPTSGVFSDGIDWAIFGFDGSIISMTLDLTNVGSMTWEEFVPANNQSSSSFAFVVLRPGRTPPFDFLGPGTPISLTNPRERLLGLSMFTGVHRVDIAWTEVSPAPGEEFPAPTIFDTGFINTITFHLVPEPSTIWLILASIIGLALIRQRTKLPNVLVPLAILVTSPLPAQAVPIVFDFEDQTAQGWELHNAFLHPTRGVFSDDLDWTIFGLDGSRIAMTLDLTNVASMIWEEFVPANTHPGGQFAFVVVAPGNSPPFDALGYGIPLSPMNPRERFFDLSIFSGIHTVTIAWDELGFFPGNEPPVPTLFNTGFINTISFHPVPESETIILVGIGVIGLAALRRGRRRARRRAVLPALFASLVLAVPSVRAAPAPIVFDFEDRTSQGWELGNAFLHPTLGVFSDGVDWAIFGLDSSAISMTLDLTNIVNVTWEEFVPSTNSTFGFAFIVVRPGNTPPFDVLGRGSPLSQMNPRERFFDLSVLTGIHRIDILWDQVGTLPGEEFPAPTIFNTGFINTITFHPVPEPGTLVLLVMSLVALGIYRRRMVVSA